MYQGNETEIKLPKSAYISYGAFIIAPLIYLYIAHILLSQGNIPANEDNSTGIMIFPIVAFFTAIGGVIIRNKIVKKLPIIKSNETFGEDFKQNAVKPIVIYLSFFEAISIYGFVAFLMGMSFDYLIIYTAVSILLMIVFRPDRRFLDDLYESQIKLVNAGKFMSKSNYNKWGFR